MERKVPPPRGFGAPPVANGAQQQPFARRNGPPTAFGAPPMAANAEQNAPPPPQTPQSFGFPAVHTNVGASRRGWKPGRVGGRHDSPLYGKHRKRPSSSSIDSNVSWSGSEIESVGGQEQVSRLSFASSVAAKEEAPSTQDLAPAASLFGTPAVQQPQQPPPAAEKQTTGSEVGMGVQPPKTPLGKPTQDVDGGISAAQRVRMELSAHADNRAGSRANSSENVFATPIPPVYDEEKSGPQSCPSMFNNTRQPQFSIDKIRQLRSNELVASKLLPTRTSVNSLMGYVRELQLSEATLRKQLVKTKQHTEQELSHSLSKVSELERTMQEVERDRENARRKLEEQEQMIRDLAAKLKQAEAAKTKSSTGPAVDELPPIAEEASPQTETMPTTLSMEKKAPDTPGILSPTPVLPVEPPLPPMPQEQASKPPVHSGQQKNNSRAEQFGLASPRSPNRPLWDPWASGGSTPMKNLPPVFTLGSTDLDQLVPTSTSAVQTSMTDSITTAAGEFELKSVLMSPRREHDQAEASENGNSAQQMQQNDSTAAVQQEFPPQYSGPAFNVPSPPYASETQNESYGVQDQEAAPLMKSSSQATPILPVETKAVTDDSSFEQQQHGVPSVPTPTESLVAPVGQSVESSEGSTPPHPLPDHSSVQLSLQTLTGNDQPPRDTSELAALKNGSVEVAHSEQASNVEANNTSSSLPNTPLQGSSPPMAPPTSDVHPPRPASPAQIEQDSKPVPAEPVTLETLLVDFFTEVDKKRLKMAKVYGKRYAGREKWLFAELTKRYGAAKVAALKTRFENGRSGDVSTATSNGDGGKSDHHPAQSSNVSDHPKAGRQGHPRHPQFFHPPTPASNVDLSADMTPVPPPVTQLEKKDMPNSQSQQEAEGAGTPPIASGKVSSGHTDRVSPRQRHKTENISAFSGPPPSIPTRQETDKGNNAVTTGTDGPPLMNGPPFPSQHEEQTGQFNSPSPPPPGRMNNNNAAHLGLHQRHNASRPTTQGQKNAEPPAVTLEGLLKELYKTHQPDKLKNVSIVAKQYAGKERELVGLLKGKYGALSVKRLEENLEVLERAHGARMSDKNTGKKRGCFVRTISLVFWLSVLLYFSFGAVFVSFVVLDAWECHGVDSNEQELESEECLPLKKELDAFTYERVADYMSQSHPDACFCSEWKARESALFTNLSGDDLLNLARLVPFSPDSFGAPWVVSVKEQVPSQEFYDSYAKPVVDLSLDVGSFVWSSVLELAGYDEASEEKSVVVESIVDNDAAGTPSFDEGSESDAHTDSLEQLADEVENESFFNEIETTTPLGEEVETPEVEAAVEAEVEAEVEAAVETEINAEAGEVVVSSEQIPVYEEATTLDGEFHTGESGIVTGEDEFVENIVPAEDETATVSGESSSFEATDEEHTRVESTDPLELGNVPMEKPESANIAEEELVDVAETEVTEILTEDDGVITGMVDTKSVDDGGASGAEVVVDGIEAVSDVVVEENEEASEIAAESDDIVEVEVRQEGLELSYPETETTDENQHVESDVESDVLVSNGLDEETEPVLGGVEDVSSTSSEAEMEVIAESDNVSVDGLKEESEPVADAVEVDVESVDEELVTSADVVLDVSPEMNVDDADTAVDDDGSIPDDVEKLVLESEDGESADSSPSDTVEVEVGVGEDSIPIEAEEETPSDEVEVVASEGGHADVLVEEESVVAEVETELLSSSSNVDAPDLASEDSIVSLSNEEAVVIDNVVGESDEELAIPVEVEEDDAEVVASNNVDELVIPAEVEASLSEDAEMVASDDVDESADIEAAIPEMDAEGGIVGVSNEGVVEHELSNDLENEPTELKEEVDAISAEVESVVVEGGAVDVEASSPEAQEDIVDGVVDEITVGNDDADVTTLSEAESEQSTSEVDVVSELVEESVAIEVTDASDADSAEVAQDVSIDDAEIFGSAAVEGEEDAAAFADGAETRITSDIDASFADEEAAVAHEEVPVDETGVEETFPSDVTVRDEDDVDSTDEASSTGEPTIVDVESQQESPDNIDEDESGGIVSAVNEVLARLVEPFEAAKKAMPIVERKASTK